MAVQLSCDQGFGACLPLLEEEGRQAQIASLLFIALEPRRFAYLGCGDIPYVSRSYIFLDKLPALLP
jgi:hypothetical protein